MPTTQQLIDALYGERTLAETIAHLKTILSTLNGGTTQAASLDLNCTANVVNATSVFADVISGVLAATGGHDVLVTISGSGLCSMTDATEAGTIGEWQLFVDGAAVPNAGCGLASSLLPPSTAPDAINQGAIAIAAKLPAVAAGNHTIAVKQRLIAVPASGAVVEVLASAAPERCGLRLRAVEI